MQLIALILTIKISGTGKSWWRGFNLTGASLSLNHVKIAVPACLGSSLEWWAFEILALFAGLLEHPKASIAANAVVLQITTFTYCAYYGFNVAAA